MHCIATAFYVSVGMTSASIVVWLQGLLFTLLGSNSLSLPEKLAYTITTFQSLKPAMTAIVKYDVHHAGVNIANIQQAK